MSPQQARSRAEHLRTRMCHFTGAGLFRLAEAYSVALQRHLEQFPFLSVMTH